MMRFVHWRSIIYIYFIANKNIYIQITKISSWEPKTQYSNPALKKEICVCIVDVINPKTLYTSTFISSGIHVAEVGTF